MQGVILGCQLRDSPGNLATVGRAARPAKPNNSREGSGDDDLVRGYRTICKVPGIFGNCPYLPRLILPCEGMLAAIASTLVLHKRKPAVVACNRLAAADSSRAADDSRWHCR